MRKGWNIIFIICALVLYTGLLCGCGATGEAVPQMDLSQEMPPTLAEGVGREGSFTAKLYFLSEDGLRLVPETREISYTGNISHAQAVVEALISGPSGGLLRPSLPENVSLERMELSSDACNVYLASSYMPDSRKWLTARAAIAATVCGAEDVKSINLYLSGVEPGLNGRALGAISPITEQLDTYVTSLLREYDTFYSEASTEAGSFEARTATLYFTDFEGKLLIAKNSEVNYDRSENDAGIAALLVAKLQDGDANLEPVIPAGLTLSERPVAMPLEDVMAALLPESEESDSPHPQDPEQESTGKKVVVLRFEAPAYSYDPDILAGALTLTITGYIPNIEGVAIYVREMEGGYKNLAGEAGYFNRADFENSIGAGVYLPFPDVEGSMLHRVPRAVSGRSAYDPQVRLGELFKGPADPGLLYPLFTEEDIGGVYVTGDLAVLNWKRGFSEKLTALIETDAFNLPKERRERLFIYSVVNAITEIPGIQRVWMLEDGKKLGTVKDIYLGNALLRNPGIMINEG